MRLVRVLQDQLQHEESGLPSVQFPVYGLLHLVVPFEIENRLSRGEVNIQHEPILCWNHEGTIQEVVPLWCNMRELQFLLDDKEWMQERCL